MKLRQAKKIIKYHPCYKNDKQIEKAKTVINKHHIDIKEIFGYLK